MKFKRVKKWLALGLAVTMLMSTPLMASATGLKDLFNAKFYADTYADLKEAFGYDEDALYNHFLTYGLKEGRNMNPILDVVAYRDAYGDLQEAFGDNWDAYVEHFLTYGVYEKNRREGVLLDPLEYLESYSDLKAAFGDDILAAIQHYQDYGYQEKRTEGTANGYSSIAEAKRAEEQAAAAAAASQSRVEKEFTGYGYTVIEYDDAGNIIKETYKSYDGSYGYTQVYAYNGNDDETDYWYYDIKGNLSSHRVISYDAQGRAVKITGYDKDGKLTWYDAIEWSSDTESKIVYYDSEGNKTGYSLRKHDGQKNVIASTSYTNEGKVTGSSAMTYNDKKMLTSKSYDADGKLIYSSNNTYYDNGRLKVSSYVNSYTEESSYSSTQTYDEDGYMTSSSYAYPDYSNKSTYEYYPGGPVKKITSEEKGKNYEGKEYTTASVSEYSEAGICVKHSYKTTYADGTSYDGLTVYNSEGRQIHYEESSGYMRDYSYYASGALKQDAYKYSDGGSGTINYSDAGSYLTDWQEQEKYRVSSTWCSSDGKSKSVTTYNADGTYVDKNTYTSSDGSVYVSTYTYDAQHRVIKEERGDFVATYSYNADGSFVKTYAEENSANDGRVVTEGYDADHRLVSYRGTLGNGDYDENVYYPGGNGSIKTKTVHNAAEDWYIVFTLKDAGYEVDVWNGEEVRPYLITWEWIASDVHVVDTFHEDGSYTETVTYSDGTVEVIEFDADGNEIVPNTPAQGSVSSGDAVQGG